MQKSWGYRVAVSLFWAVLLILCSSGSLFGDTASLEGNDLLFVTKSSEILPEDTSIGPLYSSYDAVYGEKIVTLAKAFFAGDPEGAEWDTLLMSTLRAETRLMFSVLYGETLFPKLPAAGLVTGMMKEENGIVNLPVRVVFADSTVPGELFFEENTEGWRMISGNFKFDDQ